MVCCSVTAAGDVSPLFLLASSRVKTASVSHSFQALPTFQVKKHIHAVRLYLTKGEVHTVKQGGNYPIKLLLEEIPLRLSWQQGAVEPAGMLGLATYLSVVPGGSDHRRR